jgi:hypothetical protein
MGVGGQCHASAALPMVKTRYPLYRRLGGPQGWSGWVQKISSPPGFVPWTIQPIASCCTDSAIPTHAGNHVWYQNTSRMDLGRFVYPLWSGQGFLTVTVFHDISTFQANLLPSFFYFYLFFILMCDIWLWYIDKGRNGSSQPQLCFSVI